MTSLLVEQEKDLTMLIEAFTSTFDHRYLQSEKVRLKDILNVASILFNNCNRFPKDYTSDLINIALNSNNKPLFGFQALTLATELLGFYADDGFDFIYEKIRKSLNDFSVDVVPLEF